MQTTSRALLLLALLTPLSVSCGGSEAPHTPEDSPETASAPEKAVETPSSEVTQEPSDELANDAEEASTQEVTLPEVDPTAQAVLEVTVSLEGQPVGNLPFDVHWLDEGNPSKTASRTNPDGSRRIPFEHGVQLLRVLVNPGPFSAPKVVTDQVTLLGGRVHKVHVEVPRGGIVSGIVMDVEGNPVPGASVVGFFETAESLEKREFPAGRSLSTSDENGVFRMGGFPQGPFTLEAAVEGQTAVWRPGGVIKAGQELSGLEIMLEPSFTAYGQVLDANDQPIAGATIVAGKVGRRRQHRETAHEQVFHYPTRGILTSSDKDGTFQLPGVPESQSWNLTATHPEFKRKFVPIDPGQLDVWVEMSRGAHVRGLIRNGEGQPLGQVQAWMLTDQGEPSTFSGFDGRYLFGGLDPIEKAYFIFYKPGHGMAFLGPMEVKEGMEDLDITLAGGHTIQGVVLDAAGEPMSGVGLRIAGVIPEPGFPSLWMPEKFLDQYAVLSGPDGSFAFEGLYEGTFTLTASSPGKAKIEVEGVVSGGAAVELKFAD